jgi:hypothetical protein
MQKDPNLTRNEDPIIGRRLGRLPRVSDRRALLLSQFLKTTTPPPTRTNFWTRRAPFPMRDFGNDDHGCCTIAKQVAAAMRMERFEQRRTIEVSKEDILRVYYAMTARLYGGGDTGAYEMDAMNNWRRPELTFKDVNQKPYTIDGYVGLNPANFDEIKRAIATSGARGIAICLNLPAAWINVTSGDLDTPPDGDPALGGWRWTPGSWGGHSMWCRDYDEVGLWLPHTWTGMPDQRITWRAAARYMDEATLVIDSINVWTAQKRLSVKVLNEIREAINDVSSHKIAA